MYITGSKAKSFQYWKPWHFVRDSRASKQASPLSQCVFPFKQGASAVSLSETQNGDVSEETKWEMEKLKSP